MISPETKQAIQAVLLHTAETVRQQVAGQLHQLDCPDTLIAGAWSNAQGVAVGHVSYFPEGRLSSASIDALLSVIIEGQSAGVVTDVAWSDGTVIAEVGTEQIEFADEGHLVAQLTSYVSAATAKLYSSFLAAVIERQ